jgi:hypothetical protein
MSWCRAKKALPVQINRRANVAHESVLRLGKLKDGTAQERKVFGGSPLSWNDPLLAALPVPVR